MKMSTTMLLTSFGGGSALPIQCGVASAVFQTNPSTLTTAVKMGKLSFWWNWNTEPLLDDDALDAATITAANAAFVPMLWGQATPESYDFLKDKSGDVMGYNEPDLYGPACCNCDAKQTYHPATSSGWLPLFNPASAATFWVDTVNNLTSSQRSGTTLRRIVSPSMANDAAPTPGVDCTLDPASAANPSRCEGWLSLFKKEALKQSCVGFDGKKTNCWDVIEVLQIHAYAHAAADVLTKIQGYANEFVDDFAGTGGRSKKTLWLTEVAGGTSDGTKQTQFATELMATSGGLGDRTMFPYVERVSWFSEMSFPAFNVSGVVPKENEAWTSSLFNPFGGLTPVGDAFFANCADAQ